MGLSGGILACDIDCQRLRSSAMHGAADLRQRIVDRLEVCDGANLDGKSCNDFGRAAGTLVCAPNCLEFLLDRCGGLLSCGNGQRDAAEVCEAGPESGRLRSTSAGTAASWRAPPAAWLLTRAAAPRPACRTATAGSAARIRCAASPAAPARHRGHTATTVLGSAPAPATSTRSRSRA